MGNWQELQQLKIRKSQHINEITNCLESIKSERVKNVNI